MLTLRSLDASRRALARHEQLYTSLGFRVVTVLPTVKDLWFPRTHSDEIFKGNVSDSNLTPDSFILLHMFSGSPSIYLPHLIKDKRLMARVRGIVYDSAPVSFTRSSGLAAVDNLNINPLAKAMISLGGTFVEAIDGPRRRAQLDAILKHPQIQSLPSLYLCSSSDNVAPSSTVRRFSQLTPSHCRNATVVEFDSGAHCALLKSHSEEYTDAVTRFVASLHSSKL